MEHRTHVIILAVAILAVASGFILVANFQLVSEPGGYFHIAARSEPTSLDTCFDTDGGANWFVRGAIHYRDWSFLDDCSTTITESGNISVLYEGYCQSSTNPVVVQYNCTLGCKDGACVR